MKILKAKYIIVCNEKFDILENKAIVFNDMILEITDFEKAKNKYKNAQIYDCGDDIAMPAFINPHCHLEFSANQSTLIYGDFINWLESVINSRSSLSKKASQKLICNTIKNMLKSGVATIGEISSFGSDLQSCVQSEARIVFFNEILGTNEKNLTNNWNDFIQRFEKSLLFKNDLFIPAISVHSPYSTHPNLTKMACDLAKKQNLIVSTHFLESDHEFLWLEKGKGGFKKWLSNFNKNPKPMYSVESFIENFKNIRTLFTHCVYAKDFTSFDKNLHGITHCAFSNRLLSKKSLNLKKLLDSKMNFNIATDGLSSNISLNFFDELRTNLLIHDKFELHNLSQKLLLASTLFAGRSLGLNTGSLEQGKISDIAVYNALDINDKKELELQLILHTKQAKLLFIKGKKCNF